MTVLCCFMGALRDVETMGGKVLEDLPGGTVARPSETLSTDSAMMKTDGG